MNLYRCIFLLLVLVAFIATVGCTRVEREELNKHPDESHDLMIDAEYLIASMTFEDAVMLSDVAVLAEYVETLTHDYYVEHVFRVKDCHYGKVDEEIIYVASGIGISIVPDFGYSYRMEECLYESGKDYILILNKHQSIMYDHDRYINVTNLMLNESDKKYTLYDEDILFSEFDSFADYLLSLRSGASTVDDQDVRMYTDAEQKIALESEYIAELRIENLYLEGVVHNGNTYVCSIVELHKGYVEDTREDGTILVVIKKNTVEIGERYVVGFSQVDEHSAVYSQSADDGVVPVGDDRLNEIMKYLK